MTSPLNISLNTNYQAGFAVNPHFITLMHFFFSYRERGELEYGANATCLPWPSSTQEKQGLGAR